MDDIDREVLRLLRANGRLSQEQIAREVSLSRPAVHERIKRLEERGIIQGYTALVNWAALDRPVTAFVWVRTSGMRCDDAAAEIIGLSDGEGFVEECHRVTGEWCLLLKTRVASPLSLQALLDRIREVQGVQNTMTTLALSTISADHQL